MLELFYKMQPAQLCDLELGKISFRRTNFFYMKGT